MSRIPSNYKTLLTNSRAFRDYCLKPFGLDTPVNCYAQKPQPYVKFVKQTVTLVRSGRKVEQNVLAFKGHEHWSKPELKQYFEKLYGLDVKKVNTARFMGKVKQNMNRSFRKTSNFKKIYVETEQKIDPILNVRD